MSEKELLQEMYKVEKKYKEIEAQRKELQEKIKSIMEESEIKDMASSKIKITYTAPTMRKSFDSKSLEADNPDLYSKYLKESEVSASVRIKLL